MKGQVVTDFLVDHAIAANHETFLVKTLPWRQYFDGSVCSKGCGMGCAIISPSGVSISLSVRLEFTCTNN
jgi:hypothetical protein